jgi:DNA-binding NtrC family response regulator
MSAMLAKGLGRKAFHCQFRTSADEGLTLMETEAFDVVVTDLNMRAMNGLELCARIVANQPDVPVVVITAFGSIETAVGAIRAGAYDFITKPVDVEDDLPERIRDYRVSHVLVAAEDPSELVPMEEVERRYIARVREGRRIKATGPNPRASSVLAITDSTPSFRGNGRPPISPACSVTSRSSPSRSARR